GAAPGGGEVRPARPGGATGGGRGGPGRGAAGAGGAEKTEGHPPAEHLPAVDQLPLARPEAGRRGCKRGDPLLSRSHLRDPLSLVGKPLVVHGEATRRAAGQDGHFERG